MTSASGEETATGIIKSLRVSENLLDNSENEGKLTTKVEKASLTTQTQVAASTPLQNSELHVCTAAVCGGAV